MMVWFFIKRKIPIDQQLKILYRIPIYRYFLRLQTSFQFAAHFGSLLKAGLSLKQILYELTVQQRLPILSFYAKLLTIDLNRGFHLSSQLAELPLIEKQLENIFQKNTDMKLLEKDLSLYSEILLEELQRKIISAIMLIQPIFYIVLGIFIVFIYLSLMLPMFQLINSF
jgi:competence protein ComGB